MPLRVDKLAHVGIQVSTLMPPSSTSRPLAYLPAVAPPIGCSCAARVPEHHLVVAHAGPARLLAAVFELPTADDLARAARLPGASVIEAIDEPGGGYRVRLSDRDGNGLELVHDLDRTVPINLPRHHFNSGSKTTAAARGDPTGARRGARDITETADMHAP